jgi:hypothetical protein
MAEDHQPRGGVSRVSSLIVLPRRAPRFWTQPHIKELWHVSIANTVYTRPEAFAILRQWGKGHPSSWQNKLGMENGMMRGNRTLNFAGHELLPRGRNLLSWPVWQDLRWPPIGSISDYSGAWPKVTGLERQLLRLTAPGWFSASFERRNLQNKARKVDNCRSMAEPHADPLIRAQI